jgi:isopenicillin N synthase-like dioxygenase
MVYFQDGKEIAEPEEAGLYIIPTDGKHFEKVPVADKSILLFQVGEFGQLLSNDRIRATKHTVKKVQSGIERFTFALFYSANDDTVVNSISILTADARYADHKVADGSITAGQWQQASYARYRAK